ncbi:MAG: tetratricopeptide repeat protein [Proteobacteria bacterium]|nr:tetratricopeptide repeat protein [Pseudomonadota bacterium]
MLKFTVKPKNFFIVVLLGLAVFACYLPTLNNGFIWDDNYNFIENNNYRGLSLSHLYWMFTTFHDANYHPLTWLSLGFDFVLWGMNPAGYHLTNIVLHVINTISFYFLIIALLQRTAAINSAGSIGVPAGAVFGALFFAVHPLRVETVSWISTRGDLVCGVFYILTIIAYLRMNDNLTAVKRRKWFLLSLLFFTCSLLSRAWGITMPLVLLILDAYPLGRFDFISRSTSALKKILIEKLPFALLAFGTAVFAIQAKRGSMLMVSDHGTVDRFVQATYGLYFYIFKTVLPVRLSPFYLLDKAFNPLESKYIFSVLAVFGITLCLTVMRHRWPWALTAWACYAVIVSPLLGFVQSGPQIAADRYTYLSCMPFGVLAGAGMFRLGMIQQKARLFSALLLLWIGLLVLSVISFQQTRIWYDNRTFWDHVIKLDPDNYVAYNNRGVFLKEQAGDLVQALKDYNAAIGLYPENEGAYYNRGLLYEKQGDLAAAVADYSSVIRLNPRDTKAYNNRGILRDRLGDWAGALADFKTTIRLAPFSPEAYANRGMIRLSRNDLIGAMHDLTKAIAVASTNWIYRAQVEKELANIRTQLEKKPQ